MVVKLYWMSLSSPSRAVAMTLKTLKIDSEFVIVDILKGEQMTPEYLKMNPQHTIPTVQDGDLFITESRAALQYLADAYGKDDSYYPKDLKKRSLVNSRLFFDGTNLYPAYTKAYYTICLEKKHPSEADIKKLDESLNHLENFLTETSFVAGENVTIADFTFVSTLTTIQTAGHSFQKFPKIISYLENMKGLISDYEETNGIGAEICGQWFESQRKLIPT